MSILDINAKGHIRQIRKSIVVYLVLSAFAVVVSTVYGLFGHGVYSNYMTWMFLYPLIGGALFFFVIHIAMPHIIKFSGYRIFFNSYNSAIAVMSFGSFLKGILEIAGTESPYTIYFYVAGGMFFLISFIVFSTLLSNIKKIATK